MWTPRWTRGLPRPCPRPRGPAAPAGLQVAELGSPRYAWGAAAQPPAQQHPLSVPRARQRRPHAQPLSPLQPRPPPRGPHQAAQQPPACQPRTAWATLYAQERFGAQGGGPGVCRVTPSVSGGASHGLCSPQLRSPAAGGGRSSPTAVSSRTSSTAPSSASCSASPVTGWVAVSYSAGWEGGAP